MENVRFQTYLETNDAGCRYGYWRCRYELKRIFLYAKKNGYSLKLEGRAVSDLSKRLKSFSGGKIKFDDIFLRNSIVWYPEDYVSYPSENTEYKQNELEEFIKIDKEFNRINSY